VLRKTDALPVFATVGDARLELGKPNGADREADAALLCEIPVLNDTGTLAVFPTAGEARLELGKLYGVGSGADVAELPAARLVKAVPAVLPITGEAKLELGKPYGTGEKMGAAELSVTPVLRDTGALAVLPTTGEARLELGKLYGPETGVDVAELLSARLVKAVPAVFPTTGEAGLEFGKPYGVGGKVGGELLAAGLPTDKPVPMTPDTLPLTGATMLELGKPKGAETEMLAELEGMPVPKLAVVAIDVALGNPYDSEIKEGPVVGYVELGSSPLKPRDGCEGLTMLGTTYAGNELLALIARELAAPVPSGAEREKLPVPMGAVG